MKKQLLITVFSLLSLFVQAQTFVCTDVQIYSEDGKSVSANKVQKRRAEVLGSKITLKVFDNSAKLIDPKGSSLVLDKSYGKDDEYYTTEKDLWDNVKKFVLKLNKTFGYIRSVTIEYYFNNKLEAKITGKRD